MTSKEIVQKLFDRCIACCFSLTDEQEQQILKDLEVLEILKKHKEPTVEVEPIRYGKWLDCGLIRKDGDEYQLWRCSECIVPNYRKSRYCPYCGAKMDEKENEK